MKQTIECNLCGEPLTAANNTELVAQIQEHYAQEHRDNAIEESEARELVDREAYEAGDA